MLMLTLRSGRAPFRLSFFGQSQMTRSLSTRAAYTSKTSTRPRRKRPRFAELYRTTLDLHPYSCEWESWEHRRFLDVNSDWHDLSDMEFFVRRVGNVFGTIRPLAFLKAVQPCVAFEVASRYYWLNTKSNFLERFGGRWRSHDAFLAALTSTQPPVLKGAVHEFPPDVDVMYAVVCKEQKRKRRAAEAAERRATEAAERRAAEQRAAEVAEWRATDV
ncbi:hypothetical protein C8F01DRAFT_127054 [Mycena amicta]|nr:hypothetical protein C8F01DRAFT_127054 [Mycena amicta]